MCNYTDKFQQIQTLPELYEFRQSLREDASKKSSRNSKEIDFENIEFCQNANYFIGRVEERIAYLESNGLSLDKIALPSKH